MKYLLMASVIKWTMSTKITLLVLASAALLAVIVAIVVLLRKRH